MHRFILRIFGKLQLTIRGRIWLLNLVAILALTFIVIYSLLQTESTQNAIQHIIRKSFPGVLLVTDLESNMQRLHVNVAGMTMETDSDRLQKDQLQFDKERSEISQMLDQCELLLLSKRQKGLLEELKDELKSYFQASENVHNMAVAGNLEIAQAVLVGSVSPYLQEIDQVIENLRIEAGRDQKTETEGLDRVMQRAVRFGGVAFISVFLLLSSGIILQRCILQPLRLMNDTIRKIAQHSKDAADITLHSGEIAVKNAAVIRSGVAEIVGVENTVRQAAEQIFDLVDAGKKIGSVVDEVKNITKQTNLLALNAAIEAVRAGEAGRGFKVVAGEIRNLVADTEKAATEIDRRVVNMQTVSTESAAAMENIMESVRSGVSANNIQIIAQNFTSIINRFRIVPAIDGETQINGALQMLSSP